MKTGLVLRATMLGVCVAGVLLSGRLGAQTAPPATVNQALLAMSARAGVIFAGHVVAIDHEDAAGYVDVRFRIDQAVRACPQSGWYVMREWAGLWAGGSERYQVGQRLLMLLYARGPSGMSSPVNGLDGAIPIVAGGIAPIADAAGVAPPDAGTTPLDSLVDLRWVQAQTMRSSANGANAVEAPVLPMRSIPAPAGSAAISGQASYASVMSLLVGSAPVFNPPVARPIGLHEIR